MSRQQKDNQQSKASQTKPIGVLMLAVAFLPWAAYWFLTSLVETAGIPIALGISLALLAQQISSKRYRLMDLTAAGFFTVAGLLTYTMSAALLIGNAGPVSFAVLTLMAVASMAIKRPFSSDTARYDYPRQYWKNPDFISVHNIITLVWAGVFFVCAIVTLFTTMPSTAPLVVGLVVAGFVFSLVFQSKGPAYLIQQRFKPYEWHVDVLPMSSTQENEYDVAVVGAGVGGLSTAALLAKRGFKVLVMEQQAQVGGYCSSLVRDDFVFSTGVTSVSGVWDNGPVRRLFNALDVSTEGRFIPGATRYSYKGQNIDVGTGIPQLVKSLDGVFPGQAAGVSAFFQEASEAYYQFYEFSSRFGTPLPNHLIVRLLGEKAAARLPRDYPAMYDWMNKTYQQKLDEHIDNEDLKTFLAAMSGRNGTAAVTTPGLRALLACIGPAIEGNYFPLGGPYACVEMLANVIQQHGGTIMTNYKVDRILSDRRQVRGVRSGSDIFQAHVVVSNANARTCVLQLVEANEIGGRYIDFVKSLKMSRSAFVVYAGVDKNLTSYPTYIHHVEGDFSIFINSNADSRLAPPGSAAITLTAPIGYNDFPSRDERTYEDRKRQFTAFLIRKAEEIIPDLSGSISVLDAATPRTFESYTSMPEGAMYGFDQSLDARRPHFRTPIKGLYLAGASTFPGAGIESVVMSGIICANDISGWNSETRS